MISSVPKQVGKLIWPIMVSFLVLLAVYISGARLLLTALPDGKSFIQSEFSKMVSGQVRLSKISGSMDVFSPLISVSDLSISLEEGSSKWLKIRSATIRIDPWQTILSGNLGFDQITLVEPEVYLKLPSDKFSPSSLPDLPRIFQGFNSISVRGARLFLEDPTKNAGAPADMLQIDFLLQRQRNQHILNLAIENKEGNIVSVVGSGTGNPFVLTSISADLHGIIRGSGLNYLSELLDTQLKTSGEIGFWLGVTEGENQITLNANLENLSLTNGASRFSLDRVSFESKITGNLEAAKFWVQNLSLEANGQKSEIKRIQLSRDRASLKLRSKDVDIGLLCDIALESGAIVGDAATALQSLNPQGSLATVEWSTEFFHDSVLKWKLSSQVNDFSADPYRAVPGLSGIDASIQANESSVTASVLAHNSSIYLPFFYHEPIPFASAAGRISATLEQDLLSLRNGLFSVKFDDYDVLLQYEMDLPLQAALRDARSISFSAAVTDASSSIIQTFVPHRMSDSLNSWLKSALPSAQINQGTFLWHGSLKPYGHVATNLQIHADMSDATFNFKGDWPPFQPSDLRLNLDDNRGSIWSSHGTIAGLPVDRTSVDFTIAATEKNFSIATTSRGTLSQIKMAMAELPSLAFARPIFQDITVNGSSEAQLEMSFNINDLPRSLDLGVTTAFQNAVLASKLLNLTATEVSGQLVFDSANGFQSDVITGLVFDTPVIAKIGPELTTTLAPLAAAEIKLLASVEAIKNWQSIGQALPFTGETTVTISVLVNDNISIDIGSDLVGVEIDMPGTWGKKESLRAPIQLRWDSADTPQWDIFWSHRASALIQNRQKNRLSGLIDLTPRAEPIGWKSKKLDPGLTIVGDIPLLNIPEWAPLLSRFQSSALGSKAFQPHFSKVKLQKLIWGSSDLGSVEVDFDFSLTEPQGSFSFPWLAGHIRVLSEGEADGSLVNIDITKLGIDQVPSWFWAENHMSDFYPNNMLDKILPARVSLENIFFKNSNLGGIEFRLTRQAQKTLLFDELLGEIGGIRILSPTELIWVISNESSRTELSLTAEFDDLGFSLQQVGLPKLLETRNGNLKAAWSWQGSPVEFEINRVIGKLDLGMDSGSFLSANTEMTDAMRLLSLLNLSGLFRRANINQLFDPGVTFDRAVGDFEFKEGHLSIPDFAIEGSGGYFNFSSEVDLISDTIDGELVVTLPLVENIPWVAALAGGIPMAAGTYLVSKIFEDQVNQLSSGVYSVNGSLSSPKVIFERVFDAQTR